MHLRFGVTSLLLLFILLCHQLLRMHACIIKDFWSGQTALLRSSFINQSSTADMEKLHVLSMQSASRNPQQHWRCLTWPCWWCLIGTCPADTALNSFFQIKKMGSGLESPVRGSSHHACFSPVLSSRSMSFAPVPARRLAVRSGSTSSKPLATNRRCSLSSCNVQTIQTCLLDHKGTRCWVLRLGGCLNEKSLRINRICQNAIEQSRIL
jgi:hypothetical protein